MKNDKNELDLGLCICEINVHVIQKEVSPRANSSRSNVSFVFHIAFLYQFFFVMAESHKTLQAVIWDILFPCGDRVTSDAQEKLQTVGVFVKLCRVKKKKCVGAGGKHERMQDDAYGTGVTV